MGWGDDSASKVLEPGKPEDLSSDPQSLIKAQHWGTGGVSVIPERVRTHVVCVCARVCVIRTVQAWPSPERTKRGSCLKEGQG